MFEDYSVVVGMELKESDGVGCIGLGFHVFVC